MNAFTNIAAALTQPTRKARGKPGPKPAVEVGQRYHEWTVIAYTPSCDIYDGKRSKPMCTCRCSCGAIGTVSAHALTAGRSKSCGHLTNMRGKR